MTAGDYEVARTAANALAKMATAIAALLTPPSWDTHPIVEELRRTREAFDEIGIQLGRIADRLER